MNSEDSITFHFRETMGGKFSLLAILAKSISGDQQTISGCCHHTYEPHHADEDGNHPFIRTTPNSDSPLAVSKVEFLDSFAELLSRKEYASFVSSDALIERVSKATVLAARNNGFDKVDDEFFPAFSDLVKDINKRQLWNCVSGFVVETG